MARGWGRSEEDLEAEREQAREKSGRNKQIGSKEDVRRDTERHAIELSLSRIEQLLSQTPPSPRRQALEKAKKELKAKLGV